MFFTFDENVVFDKLFFVCFQNMQLIHHFESVQLSQTPLPKNVSGIWDTQITAFTGINISR
jgi:hypothetical protein